MRKIIKVVLVGCLVLMMLSLGGCGFSKDKVFTSTDGIHINGTMKWKEATEKQILEEIYTDMSKEDLDFVDMALVSRDGLTFLIEKGNISEFRDSIIEEVGFIQDLAKEIKEMNLAEEEIVAVFAEMGLEFTEEDKVYLEEVSKEDFNLDDYINDYMGESWEASLAEQYTTFKLIDKWDEELLGEDARMREYTYKNNIADESVHAYELDVVKGDMMYTIYASASESDFDKYKEELKVMIMSAYEGEIVDGK